MATGTEDTMLSRLFQHGDDIAQLKEHTRDGHADIVSTLLERVNNLQEDVFKRIDEAKIGNTEFIKNIVNETLQPVLERLDALEDELTGDSNGKNSNEIEDDLEVDGNGVELDVPDISDSPKPVKNERVGNRRKRLKARRAAAMETAKK